MERNPGTSALGLHLTAHRDECRSVHCALAADGSTNRSRFSAHVAVQGAGVRDWVVSLGRASMHAHRGSASPRPRREGRGGAGTRRSADSRCSALVCRHRRTISACTAAHRQQVAKHGPARRGPPIGDLPGARTLATVAPAVGPLVPGYSVGRCCEWREGTHPGGSVPPQSGKRVVPPQRQDVAHR